MAGEDQETKRCWWLYSHSYGIDDFDTLPNQDEDNSVNVDDDDEVQGGEWEEDEDEPHLAYPGPHARGQVTDDEVMTKQGNCSSRKPPKQSMIYVDHLIM